MSLAGVHYTDTECGTYQEIGCAFFVNICAVTNLKQLEATAQPKMLRYSLENKRYMTPDDIVDAVETSLEDY